MMVGGSAPVTVEGREVFMGTFKGVKVRPHREPYSLDMYLQAAPPAKQPMPAAGTLSSP